MDNEIYEVRASGEECRAVEKDGKRYLEGYAAIYEQKSKLIHERWDTFFEVIKRGAFDEVLNDPKLDVIATPNHSYDKVLARTISGTLQLSSDDRGLRYSAEMPDTTYGNDIYESVKRGDTFESSFTFMVEESGQTWSVDDEGVDLRFVNSVKILREVAPVTWGAYANTAVIARGYNEFQKSKTPKNEIPLNLHKRKLQILKLKK